MNKNQETLTQVGRWLIDHYFTAMKRKDYSDANCIFTLILNFGRTFQMPHLKDEVLKKLELDKVKLDTSLTTPLGDNVKEIFTELDKSRGYRPPKRNAEAASILRMLKKGYPSKEILRVWQTLKQDKFWQDKELFMMTVESQIGAMTQKIKTDSDKYIKGKYGHMVRR